MRKKEVDQSVQTEEQQDLGVKEAEQKFPLAVLRDQCMSLYSITFSTFAGATSGIPDGEYTVVEVRRMIDTWLNKEVQ